MNKITKRVIGLCLVFNMMFIQMNFVIATTDRKVDILRYEICTQCYKGNVTYKDDGSNLAGKSR